MSELKIEAGKYYKTRDGRKAYVVSIGGPLSDIEQPAIVQAQGSNVSEYTINGRYSVGAQPSVNDLIAPWPDEPEEREIDGVKYRKQLAWVPVE